MRLTLLSLLMYLTALVACPAADAADAPMSTVIGRIQASGVETYRGVAALWDGSEERIPDPRRYTIIPYSVVPLAPDGSFEMKVRPGRYYLGAILRTTPGPAMGPPRPGDLIFLTPDKEGNALLVELQADTRIDVGTHAKSWRYAGFRADDGIRISGRVTDDQGEPVPNLLVFAFADRSVSEMPLAVSERTDAEGRYLLRLDRPGEVFLRVRENYGGGTPTQGGYMGVYGGRTPALLRVSEQGEITGIDVTVFRLPPAGSLRRELLERKQPGQEE